MVTSQGPGNFRRASITTTRRPTRRTSTVRDLRGRQVPWCAEMNANYFSLKPVAVLACAATIATISAARTSPVSIESTDKRVASVNGIMYARGTALNGYLTEHHSDGSV